MLADLLADALRNARAHWLRVLLTASGILWGIALFTVMMATGTGIRLFFRERTEAIGRKVIYAFPGVVPKAGADNRLARRVVLDVDDPPRLPASPLVERSAPELWSGARTLKGGGHIKVVWTFGVAPETGAIRNFQVARGRFITRRDMETRARVLVVGAKVEERLFGRRSALGRAVRLDGHPFRIVGVSVPKGEQMVNLGPRDDEQVLMPLSTAQTLFTGTDDIGYLIYEPRSREESPQSITRVRTILGRHHRFVPADEEALGFFNIADAVKLFDLMGISLQIFVITCGALTLAAGGVGVMNTMLVAVAERTRELGLRKALGATDRDLFVALLGETVLVTVAAGLGGLGLGAGIVAVLQALRDASPRADFLLPRVILSPTLALVSFGVLVGVGVLAGLAPARRAARLDPAVALREE